MNPFASTAMLVNQHLPLGFEISLIGVPKRPSPIRCPLPGPRDACGPLAGTLNTRPSLLRTFRPAMYRLPAVSLAMSITPSEPTMPATPISGRSRLAGDCADQPFSGPTGNWSRPASTPPASGSSPRDAPAFIGPLSPLWSTSPWYSTCTSHTCGDSSRQPRAHSTTAESGSYSRIDLPLNRTSESPDMSLAW